MAIIASDGSLTDVNAKRASASAGDTVTIPSGTFTWGAGGAHVVLDKAITLQGAGTGSTTIVLSETGTGGGGGVIEITAAATVKDFSITGSTSGANPFACWSASGFRVTNIVFNGGGNSYFAYCAGGDGVFDHCTINSNAGESQMFQIRGPASWWNTAHTMGTSQAIFIEDCTFNGDATAAVTTGGAGRAVVRFCTINGAMAIDSHMIQTETTTEGTPHGSRQLEVYNVTWTKGDYFPALLLAGGTSMIFDNRFNNAISWAPWIHIFEYGAQSNVSSGLPYVATPAHSPIPDQPGMGAYPQTAGAEPVYFWQNLHQNGTGTEVVSGGVHASAITAYGSTFYQLSEEGSPYMLLRGRDYLRDETGGSFPSTSDIGHGTKAQMLASSPTAAKQAWVATDEGSWRSSYSGTSGQLYTWSGSAWVLNYTPYTYPHPLNDGGTPDTTPATLVSATVPTGGTTVTLAFDEAVTRNAATPTVSLSGGACTLTYSSGSGTASHVYTLSRTVNSGETGTLSVTLSAGNWADASGNSTTSISGFSVTNNSTQGVAATLTFTALTVTTLQFA